MGNMTGKFLSQWHMSEAKRQEARVNAMQKRNGTNLPLTPIIAWCCGCCIGPHVARNKRTILSSSEADKILVRRKVRKRGKTFADDVNALQEWFRTNQY